MKPESTPALPLLTPDWPVLTRAGVGAACSMREGGVSVGAYASLNLGDHVGDDPAKVAINRQRLADRLGVRPVYLKQVHGIEVLAIDAATSDGQTADACVTTQPGVACTVMVADCLPVLLAADDGSAVAAAHAGWRGLAQGVIEAAVQALRSRARPGVALSAWLGPCIGPTAFEVGDEVREAFVSSDTTAARHFHVHRQPSKWWADLPGLARDRLQALGVLWVGGNDGSVAWCTHSNASRFFSHRRDRISGRFAASIWRQ